MTPLRNGADAFRIGEDLAFHGMPLPDDACDSMQAGRALELGRRKQTQDADRFVRKWLQLRLGAWRRNRVFDPDVTPDFLRSIDVATCPVSHVVLTHATREGSDWSLDRIDNEGAYAPRNLVVLSTRVNKAKGSLSLEEIAALADRFEDAGDLSALEWRRLAWLANAHLGDSPDPVRVAEVDYDAHRHLGVSVPGYVQFWTVSMSKESAQKRKAYKAALDYHGTAESVVAYGALDRALTAYAKATPAPLRTAHEFFAVDTNWALFCRWWKVFAAAEGAKAWVANILEQLPKVGGSASPLSRMQEGYSKHTEGYH